ncbi:MAG: SBBP repeat-containing protein [Candidatus Hodarchaeota archaeon]
MSPQGDIESPLGVPQPQPSIQLPFSGFSQNLGQLNDDSIHYYYSTKGSSIGFGLSTIIFLSSTQEDATVLRLRFSLSFPGSQTVSPVGLGLSSYYTNYFYGDHQLTNVPTWEEIWYHDLYPGVDLRYYMSTQGLKYDFLVYPGVDPNQISVQVDDSMMLDVETQQISLQSRIQPHFHFQETGLQVWQDDGTPIPAQFIPKMTNRNTYGFQLESYDPSQMLIIDPIWLSFSTYLGGMMPDGGMSIKQDALGNSYIIGETLSSNFPTVNAYNSTFSTSLDIFVSKLNATGNGLIFSTYLGGSDEDSCESMGIAVDASGNVYICGTTLSQDYPLVNETGTYKGGWDFIVTKLNATGNGLIFSTYFSTPSVDMASDIEVDANGNCYVLGTIDYYPYDIALAGDVCVVKYDTNGGIIAQKILEGNAKDWGLGLTLDAAGNIYLTGWTTSTNYPTVNAYQDTLNGDDDTFVTKLNTTMDIVFSTYLGGSGDDRGHGIAVDSTGNIYLSGYTTSSDYPTVNAFQSTFGGGTGDCFVTKLNATGTGLVFSTYLGGSDAEAAVQKAGVDKPSNEIAVDANGNSYIIGTTKSNDFPILNAYQSTNGGDLDVFVTKLNTTGTGLNFSTYLGGSAVDEGKSITVDTNGNCYIIGKTDSSNFPTCNAYQSQKKGTDAFVAKLYWTDNPPATPTSTTPVSTTPSSTTSSSQTSASTTPSATSDFFTVEVLLVAFGSVILVFLWRKKRAQ